MTALTSLPIDGVLLLDKPIGITSNAAIQRVKRLLSAIKAGHVGTLDPLASGLLPVCLGEATKFSTATFGADKSYDADILLGVTTATGDTEGEVTARSAVNVSREQLDAVLQSVTGNIEQIPPMYSALKHHGKPLYAYARAGQTVPRAPRGVTVHEIDLKGFSADRVRIGVRCSKGTYIRVLAEEIGSLLGCGATLAGLRRTALGGFDLTCAVSLDCLEALDVPHRLAHVLPVDTLVSTLPRIQLDAAQQRLVLTGRTVTQLGVGITGLVRIYDQERRFLGLGEVIGDALRPKRLLATA